MKNSIAVFTFLLASFASANASAYSVVYPGSQCRAASGPHAQYASYEYAGWGIYNSSTTTAINVVCPIEAPKTFAKSPIRAGMNVIDRHATQNISCTFVVADGIGGTPWSGTQGTSGQFTYVTGFFWDPVVTKAAPGPMAILCTLPALNAAHQGSHILSYFLYDD